MHVLMAFGFAGCSTTFLTGRIVGATYPNHGVQVFSMGRGQLPSGKNERLYLHVRISVRNANPKLKLRIDPRQQVLVLPASVVVRATFAECNGHAGIATLPPQGQASMDLFYAVPSSVEEAELRWTMTADDGGTVGGRIQFASLLGAQEPITQALWVPTGQPGQDYYVSTLHPWAEPTNGWYWWRDADFPAWLRPRSQSNYGVENKPLNAPYVSIYVDDDQWYWMGPGNEEPTVSEGSFDEKPTAPQRQRGGWRHADRPRQRDIHRAKPSHAEPEEPEPTTRNSDRAHHRAEPSGHDQETRSPTRETSPQENSSSQSERQPPSDASSVGRSWRRGR